MTCRPIDLPDVLRQITQLVHERYVLEQDASAIAASLAEIPAGLAQCPADRIAEVLTECLQRTNNDRHLRVRHRADGAASRFDGPEHEARYAAEARGHAGGIRQVRLLENEVGMLEIAPYLSPIHLAEPYITAAFTLLASVPGLIIDLRTGHGGTPETVAFICGHLLGKEPVHLQDTVERGYPPRQFWTSPAATRISAPVCVLTSRHTFSGCEELAYNLQAQRRAVIIGETTGGGAHPVESFKIADVLELHLPVAKSVNVVTGTNWEQVGVIPDRPCPPTEAVQVALDELRAS